MKYSKDDATHFLSYEDPETGNADLLDCIPLRENSDGTVTVLVFSEGDAASMVCSVDASRVLTVDEVTQDILNCVTRDLALLASDSGEYPH